MRASKVYRRDFLVSAGGLPEIVASIILGSLDGIACRFLAKGVPMTVEVLTRVSVVND